MKTSVLKNGCFLIASIALLISGSSLSAQQTEKKHKKTTEVVHLKIEKDENGAVTKIDTIFTTDFDGISDSIKCMEIKIGDFEKEISEIGDIKWEENEKLMEEQLINIENQLKDLEKMDFNITTDTDGKCETVIIVNDENNDGKKGFFRKKDKNKKARIIIKNCNGDVIINDDDNKTGKKIIKKEFSGTTSVDNSSDSETIIINSDKNAISNLKFSPNPNQGKFSLSFNSLEKSDIDISVTDLNGKEVFAEKVSDFKGNYNKEIDLSSKGKGVYVVKVKQGENLIIKKVIVQ